MDRAAEGDVTVSDDFDQLDTTAGDAATVDGPAPDEAATDAPHLSEEDA
ncbi:Segregation and condensation protein A OS=Cellulomonas persica OX=76861 GN=CPE01_05890 PE=4 SV=1 [Cellulomonas persica]